MTIRDYRKSFEEVLSPRPEAAKLPREGLRIKPETNIWQKAKLSKKQRKQRKQSFQAQ